MQSFSVLLFLAFCTIVSLTDAQHHYHGHRRPTGLPHTSGRHFPFPSAPFPTGAPSASASGAPPVLSSASRSTAPYPAGNGTTGVGIGTGTGGPTGTTTLYSTRFITIEEAPLSTALASVPIGEESPTSTEAAGASGGAAPSSSSESDAAPAPSEASGSAPSGSLAAPSGILGGAGQSTCPVPITVTIRQDTTITVTAPASPSQASVESQAPVVSQPPISSAATSNAAVAAPSQAFGVTSTEISPTVSAQAATSQIPVQQMSDGQVIEPAPTSTPAEAASEAVAASSSPASSTLSIAAAATTSSTGTSLAVPAQEITSIAQASSSALAAVDTDTATTSTATSSSSLISNNVASSVAPVSSSGSTSTGSISSLIPNNIKAGVAGYRSITDKTDWDKFTPYIGWYSDYFPDTPPSGKVAGIPMLWGNGHLGDQDNDDDAIRLQLFQKLYPENSSTHPDYMFGFYEPDWKAPDSSSIDVATAAANWTSLLQPLQGKGTKLGSPSMAEQLDEVGWLETFGKAAGLIGTDGIPTWDYTVIHTNKPNVSGVINDINYYLGKYKKPIWVAEFTCIDDQTWDTCSDPTQIQNFIEQSVDYFQKNESVIAYGFNNGAGLNETWYMINNVTGLITTPGQIYIDKIKTYV